MKSVNITEFRSRLPDYLKMVKAGEEMVLTSRGKPVARLVPARQGGEKARETLASLRSRCRIGDVLSPIDEPWQAGS